MNPYAFSGQLQQSSMHQQTLWLFSGIALVLVVATLISETLRWRARAQPSAVLDNLVARIRAWWVMAGVVGIAFVFGRAGVIGLFALVSLFALREFITLTPTRRGDYYALLAAFYIVLPWQYGLVWTGWYGMYTLLIRSMRSWCCRSWPPSAATPRVISSAPPRCSGA